jgi:ornithine carbamoyltransferase
MQPPANTRQRLSLDALPKGQRQRVLDLAAALESAERAGQPVKTLRGKHLAVLCENPDCPHLGAVRQAAGSLGAQVTHIRPSEVLDASDRASDAVGNLLSRLYDAIACHGLAPEVAVQLGRATGKPVFDELDCRGDAAPASPGPAPGYLLQALLLSALT